MKSYSQYQDELSRLEKEGRDEEARDLEVFIDDRIDAAREYNQAVLEHMNGRH